MAEYQTLPNPPIIEGLIDIRTTLPQDTQVEALLAAQEALAASFPHRQDKTQWETSVDLSADNPTQTLAGGKVGYQFSSQDGLNIFQARLDGFTYSRLKPYTTWEDLIAGARRCWDAYTHAAQPVAVSRVAIRYINRLELPLPVRELKDYFLTVPEIAPGIPQDMSQYMLRLVIEQKNPSLTAIVLQLTEAPTPNLTSIPIVFDIDIFANVATEATSPIIWELVEHMRTLRNTIFFRSLTPKTLDLFK